MNDSWRIAVLASCLVPTSVQAQSKAADRPPMREAATNEQLILRLKMAEQEKAKLAPTQGPISEDPAKLERPGNLVDRSTILCSGGYMTLVPKRAVIQFPEKYADRMKKAAGAKFQDFPEFCAANRNWVSTFEVSRAQAQGKEAIDKDAKVHMTKSGNLIVATFRGNPIEVLPPAEPEEAAVGTETLTPTPQP